MRALRAGLLAAILLLCAGASEAFETIGIRWANGTFAFEADISYPVIGSLSPSGTSWNDAFASAAEEWNSRSAGLSDITVNTGVFEDPCGNTPGLNGVDFTTDVCSMALFGDSTLAIAFKRSGGGGGIIKAFIVFDEAKAFDVFTGALPLSGTPQDFKRVAVHELGHVLGLDHESVNPAIMDPFSGDTEVPQADDLNGIAALYDLGCPLYSSSNGGPIDGELTVTDCADSESGLPFPSIAQAQPDGIVDLYRVTADGSQLNFVLTPDLNPMSIPLFNPVLMLVDDSLTTEIESVWMTTSSTLNVTPPAGDYVLVVRSLLTGGGGPYTLTGVPEPAHGATSAVALATLAGLARVRRGVALRR